jgi:hypothetical protein
MQSCGISSVETANNLQLNGVDHSGVISHICHKDKGHEGRCECECGYIWTKFHTEK